jgi:hypothetical protein
MPVICPTWQVIFCKYFWSRCQLVAAEILRRGINRLRGLWPGSNRLNLRLWRGWCYLGADGVRGLRSRRIVDDPLALNMRLVPGAVIDDQQRKQADGRNNYCARERSGYSLRMISSHRIHAVSNWLFSSRSPGASRGSQKIISSLPAPRIRGSQNPRLETFSRKSCF